MLCPPQALYPRGAPPRHDAGRVPKKSVLDYFDFYTALVRFRAVTA